MPEGTRDALIVGAGPVGLLLANFLGVAGINAVLIDKRGELPSQSRAIGVTPPSLHILERLGLAEMLIEAGIRVQEAVVFDGNRTSGLVSFRNLPGPYPFILSVPQSETMRILEMNLKAFPHVERRPCTEFLDMAATRESATVRIRDAISDTTKTIRARLVLGCDGHRSAVRESGGLAGSRKRYGVSFVMADFQDSGDFGEDARLFFTPQGAVESFPLPGGRRRWIGQVPPADDEYAIEDLVGLVRERTGCDLCASGASEVSWFQPERLCCDSFGGPSLLLCGDAAHVMSPIGGQGMNTGLADAADAAGIVREYLDGGDWSDLWRGYDRRRRRAFNAAADRAAVGMWIGTRTGAAGRLRSLLLRYGLLWGPFSKRLPPHFAMLTIPHVNWPFRKRGGRARLRIGNRLDAPNSKRELNKRLFSKIAVEYRWMPAALSFGRDTVWKRRLIESLPDLSKPTCVDLACGDGDLTRRLARRFPDGDVVGLDLTPAMLSRAKHFTTQVNIRYAEADMAATGLASASADIVTGSYALRNAPDLDETIREIARILRPGGWACFLEFMRWPGRISGALEIGLLRVWGGAWGMLLHGNPAVYGYIAESLRRFPTREELAGRFAHHGFCLASTSPCFFGVTAIFLFQKDGQRREAT